MSATRRVLRPGAATTVALLAALAAGCSAGPAFPTAEQTTEQTTDRADDQSTPGTGPESTGGVSPGSTAAALRETVLRDGAPMSSQGVTVHVLAATRPYALDDSSVRVDLAAAPAPTDAPASRTGSGAGRSGTGRATDGARLTDGIVIAVPDPLRLDVLPDGTALVLDGEEPVAGLRADPTGRLEARDDVAVLLPRDEPTSVWFTGRSILDLRWGEREGGRSLAVTPSDWTREGGRAAEELTAAQLAQADPEAGTPGMLKQLACHQLGARTKARWNLEPWRPDVDPFEMIANRCNPT